MLIKEELDEGKGGSVVQESGYSVAVVGGHDGPDARVVTYHVA